MKLSVIIPLAEGEQAWRDLLPDLAALPADSEVILALPQDASPLDLPAIHSSLTIRQVREGSGRARQMNAAARTAQGAQLWFLHADSRLHPETIPALLRRLGEYPDWLLYADLVFSADAPFLMKLNEMGVWFRSHALGMPFGDQGLCIRKKTFYELGGYPEDVAYGEDHVFVWRARQRGIRLRPMGARLTTSARKYCERGWLKTTHLHLCLTLRQAWPEWRRLMMSGDKA
ncbi:MAG: glycosyltransferase [Alphaproteobacteria bacterium]|nr:glycosyltransferase [Alphaproteobacteria bacterium]